jgi:hypothetical protein
MYKIILLQFAACVNHFASLRASLFDTAYQL